jgi:hypothetical protein
MILSMMLRRQADTYMIVALIVIPILIVLIDLHEEIASLKEENKHQRKFVMDRYNALLERMKDVSSHVEKRLVVDFAEFAKNSSNNDSAPTPPPVNTSPRSGKKLKKRRNPERNTGNTAMDLEQSHRTPIAVPIKKERPNRDPENT